MLPVNGIWRLFIGQVCDLDDNPESDILRVSVLSVPSTVKSASALSRPPRS